VGGRRYPEVGGANYTSELQVACFAGGEGTTTKCNLLTPMLRNGIL